MELMSSHVDIARVDSSPHRGSSRRQRSSSMSELQWATSKPLEPRHADGLHELQSSLVLQLRPTDHRSKPARNQVSAERPRASSVQVGECARVIGASPSISCASSAARSSSSHRAALAWSIRRGARSLLSDKAHRRVRWRTRSSSIKSDHSCGSTTSARASRRGRCRSVAPRRQSLDCLMHRQAPDLPTLGRPRASLDPIIHPSPSHSHSRPFCTSYVPPSSIVCFAPIDEDD